jgi:hypothetical protein
MPELNDSTAPLTPAPTVTPEPQPHPKAGLSSAEALQMAEWTKADRLAGKISADQAEKIFTELNVPVEQRGPDQRTDEQKALDQQFPAAKPEDYRIAYGEAGQEPTMTPESKAFGQSARTWMSTAGMPKNIGDSLVNQIGRVVQQTQHMSASQLEQYGYAEFAKLEKVHGPALEERLSDAARMVHDLDFKTPGLKHLLRSKGIGDNALVVNLLLAHAPIYHAKQGR